jgi:hypothetical protein
MRTMSCNQILKLTHCRYFVNANGLVVFVTKKALRTAFYGMTKKYYCVDLKTFEAIRHEGMPNEKKYNYYSAVILP